jgi:1-acyl-sn-glycerol-3-phosphate acyltransferase
MKTSVVGEALPKRGSSLSQFIAKSLMSIFGWRIEADIPDVPKFVLVGAPHTSNWDFLLTMSTVFSLGIRISWLAKQSLFRWPHKGLMEWLGGIPVDRSMKGGGLVEQLVAAFNSREKFIVAIMPEGTRSKVREWKTGFYRIAQEAEVPIVLVRFDYGRRVMGIGPTIEASGDLAGDMAHIKAHYAGVVGKNSLKDQ